MILLIIFLPLLAYIMFAPTGESRITLLINGEPADPDTPVILDQINESEIFYVPARAVCEKLGFETSWNSSTNQLSALLGDFSVVLTVDSSIAVVDGVSKSWNAPVKFFEDTIYMPAYPAAEALGALIEWDETVKQLSIYTPREFDTDIAEEQDGPLLYVAYPGESELFRYYGDSLFVFGTTKSFALIDVTVNGEPVELYDPRSGNFLTMVQIPRGEEFTIAVEATGTDGTTRVERTVIYPDWWDMMSRDPLAFHSTRLVPSADQVLKEGDILQVAFQGSPGGEATFQIGDRSTSYRMIERSYPGGPSGTGGIYTATYRVSNRDIPETGASAPLPITVTLSRGGEQVTREMPGSITFLADSPYKIVEVKPEHELKNRGWLYSFRDNQLQLLSGTLSGSGYPASVVSYLVEGTRYTAVSAFGNYYRVVIGRDQNYLIHRDVVHTKDTTELARPLLSAIELDENVERISLRLTTTERFHFSTADGKNSLAVTMHGISTAGNIQLPALTESLVDISLSPRSGDGTRPLVFTVKIDLEMTGFKTRWDGTDLLIELYKPGKINRSNPLQDKVIIVDPGHGGSERGAIGPGGLDEKDVVLSMGLYLREMLTDAGATVIMTRTEDIDVNLYDRPERIDQYNADLFISIHANAHAANAPATTIHGIMILYNFAHNENLADIMLDTMVEESNLPRFRTWRRNIAVLRHPHVPSVLVEAGYMMHPHDNWYILHPRGQKELARAMLEGIKNYFLAVGDFD